LIDLKKTCSNYILYIPQESTAEATFTEFGKGADIHNIINYAELFVDQLMRCDSMGVKICPLLPVVGKWTDPEHTCNQ